MLLSLTATSFQPAVINASFDTTRPAFDARNVRMSRWRAGTENGLAVAYEATRDESSSKGPKR